MNLEEKIKKQEISPEKIKEIIDKRFLTETGKKTGKKKVLLD